MPRRSKSWRRSRDYWRRDCGAEGPGGAAGGAVRTPHASLGDTGVDKERPVTMSKKRHVVDVRWATQSRSVMEQKIGESTQNKSAAPRIEPRGTRYPHSLLSLSTRTVNNTHDRKKQRDREGGGPADGDGLLVSGGCRSTLGGAGPGWWRLIWTAESSQRQVLKGTGEGEARQAIRWRRGGAPRRGPCRDNDSTG